MIAKQMGITQGAEPMPQGTMADVDPAAGMEEEIDSETNPAYQAAKGFVQDALYKTGAAESMAAQLSKSRDKVQALADVSYNIISVAVEKLDGELPEELYLELLQEVLSELNDIAEAAGVKYTNSDLAEVVKRNTLRYLEESGEDPAAVANLKSAMDQVPQGVFEEVQ